MFRQLVVSCISPIFLHSSLSLSLARSFGVCNARTLFFIWESAHSLRFSKTSEGDVYEISYVFMIRVVS
jgi:hypothetical protein